MKKIIIILLFVALAVALVASLMFIIREEWLSVPEEQGLVVLSPESNGVVRSPLIVEGFVNGGGWIGFEGEVGSVRLVDDNYTGLAEGILTARGPWMQVKIDFRTELVFDTPQTSRGYLVFYNTNPSGEPERDRTFIMPVRFAESANETMKVKVYFSNNQMDPEYVCENVFAIEREAPRTLAVARAALEELLKGPEDLEKDAGFFTNINKGVAIQNINIENGKALVDFSEMLEEGVAGSCKVLAIRAQITETLKQFPTIEEVVISVNGRTEDVLQP